MVQTWRQVSERQQERGSRSGAACLCRKEGDARVKALARQQSRSANQLIENLIEAGLEAKEAPEAAFL